MFGKLCEDITIPGRYSFCESLHFFQEFPDGVVLNEPTSRELDVSQAQMEKSLEKIWRPHQIEQQRIHERQMDLGL